MLNRLPGEILCLIAFMLKDADDLETLRSINKEVLFKTSYEFERRVLEQRWRFDDNSISILLDIAKDTRFKKRLKTLRFSTFMLSEFGEPFGHTKGGLEIWRTWMREQQHFIHSARPAALMTMLLMKLPALRNVEIGQWCKGRQYFDSAHGTEAIRTATGEDLCPYYYQEPTYNEDGINELQFKGSQNLTFIFDTLLAALSVTQHRIEKLLVGLYNNFGLDHLRGIEVSFLQPLAQRLKDESAYSQGLRAALCRLRHLDLTLEYKQAWNDETMKNKGCVQWLHQFVDLARRLQSLRVYFDGTGSIMNLGEANSVYAFNYFAIKTYIPCLTSLEIGTVSTTSKSLLTLLEKHWARLQALKLQKVALRRARGHFDWAAMFSLLARSAEGPNSITLNCLYEADYNLLVFNKEGYSDCKLCYDPWNHFGDDPRLISCEHTTFTSADGSLPREYEAVKIDWASHPHYGEIGLTESEIGETVWPDDEEGETYADGLSFLEDAG